MNLKSPVAQMDSVIAGFRDSEDLLSPVSFHFSVLDSSALFYSQGGSFLVVTQMGCQHLQAQTDFSACMISGDKLPLHLLFVVVVQPLSHVWLYCDPMNCNPPGSSVHRMSQARVLEWVTISLSRGLSPPRDWAPFSYTGKRILYHWATREAQPSS